VKNNGDGGAGDKYATSSVFTGYFIALQPEVFPVLS
jgi:hypothetical protein